MSNTPWTATAYSALAGPVEFVSTTQVFTAAGRLFGTVVATLEVKSGQVTFDEEWTPYIQASITVADPGVIIDPRAGHRLVIEAGYVYPNGVRDVNLIADLSITESDAETVPGTVAITAQSDEILVQQSAQWQVVDITETYANYGLAIEDLLIRALSPDYPSIDNYLGGTGTTLTDHLVRIGEAWWPKIQTLADAAGGVVYCNEWRVWNIEDYTPDDSPNADTTLSTGDVPITWPNATDAAYNLPVLTEAGVRRSRDDWANTVMVEHVWTHTDGSRQRVAQIATVTTGPYAVATVGYRVHVETRDTPIWSEAECAAECAAILYRTQRRGERRGLTGRAAYWLRPRSLRRFWISGVDLYARITRVTFRLDGSGLMDLSTRTPAPEGAED